MRVLITSKQGYMKLRDAQMKTIDTQIKIEVLKYPCWYAAH